MDAQPDQQISGPLYYENPPVVERVISVKGEMTQEAFEAGIDGWRQEVIPEYPIEEPIIKWLLNMEEKEGFPQFNTMQPELKITHRFSKRRAKDGFDWSIRCPVGTLMMNMHSIPHPNRRFSHLRSEFERWLPRWMNQFNVAGCQSVGLLYLNVLRKDVTPGLFNDDGALRLGSALRVFSSVPGDHEQIVPPFDCRMTVLLRSEPRAVLQIRAQDASGPEHTVGVKLTLLCEAELAGKGTPQDCLELLDWCHERILDRFELVFTDEAKTTFNPRKP